MGAATGSTSASNSEKNSYVSTSNQQWDLLNHNSENGIIPKTILINLFPNMLSNLLQPVVSKEPPSTNLEPKTKGLFFNSSINSGIFFGS